MLCSSAFQPTNPWLEIMTVTGKRTSPFIARQAGFGICSEAVKALRRFSGEKQPIFPRLPIMTAMVKLTRRFIEIPHFPHFHSPVKVKPAQWRGFEKRGIWRISFWAMRSADEGVWFSLSMAR